MTKIMIDLSYLSSNNLLGLASLAPLYDSSTRLLVFQTSLSVKPPSTSIRNSYHSLSAVSLKPLSWVHSSLLYRLYYVIKPSHVIRIGWVHPTLHVIFRRLFVHFSRTVTQCGYPNISMDVVQTPLFLPFQTEFTVIDLTKSGKFLTLQYTYQLTQRRI